MEDYRQVETLGALLTVTPKAPLDKREIWIKRRMEKHAPNAFRLLAYIMNTIDQGENFCNPDFYGTEHQQIRGLLTTVREGR